MPAPPPLPPPSSDAVNNNDDKTAFFLIVYFILFGCSLLHDLSQKVCYFSSYTDKKENQIFLIYKEIQNGAAAKSYMTNGLLIYEEIFAHFLIY
jgi:hypothetical protein